MKRLSLALWLAVSGGSFGCTGYRYLPEYEFALVGATRAAPTASRADSLTQGMRADSVSFEDAHVQVIAAATNEAVGFRMRNMGDVPIRVIWNDAAIVAPDGRTATVIHRGLTSADCSRSKSPSLIPAGGYINDVALSCDASTLPACYITAADTNVAKALEGKDLRVLMPLEVGGAVQHYTWFFRVTTVTLHRSDSAIFGPPPDCI